MDEDRKHEIEACIVRFVVVILLVVMMLIM
jgi:hypothetical protein